MILIKSPSPIPLTILNKMQKMYMIEKNFTLLINSVFDFISIEISCLMYLQDSKLFRFCQARNEDIDMSYVALYIIYT